jgi:hypothetical protein
MVGAHLQEALIVLASLADEDRLNRRLPVVVDAAPCQCRLNFPQMRRLKIPHFVLD